MNLFPENCPVSGADWFMLAMDEHMTRYQPVGNVCRYVLFIHGHPPEAVIRKKLSEQDVFGWLSRLGIRKKGLFSIANWVADRAPEIPIHFHHDQTEELPEAILKINIPLNGPLFRIDVVYRSESKSTFIFSWHHLLMDGRGAGTLLKYLNGDLELHDNSILIPSKAEKLSWSRNWNNMMATKNFLEKSSAKPLGTMMKGKPEPGALAHYKVIRFTKEETAVIHENAAKHGAKFGHSPFYLASAVKAAHRLLRLRGAEDAPFWIPVPQDDRLRGTAGPLVTNQLSFIFYRIPVKHIGSMHETVNHITSQLVEQIRNRTPKNYAVMMNWFRRMPNKLYYQLIKGPGGGSIASFLFSVAADSPDAMRKFFGHEVEDAINFPPNTYPPGFTVVFMRYLDTLKIIVAYVEQAVSNEEVTIFEKEIRNNLLIGDVA